MTSDHLGLDLYHLIVSFKLCSRLYAGFHPSFSTAFLLDKYCLSISPDVSLFNTTGLILPSFPINFIIKLANSKTEVGFSVPMLKTSPLETLLFSPIDMMPFTESNTY